MSKLCDLRHISSSFCASISLNEVQKTHSLGNWQRISPRSPVLLGRPLEISELLEAVGVQPMLPRKGVKLCFVR